MFYDVTTLYFETDKQDELRQTGFSKEGRHSNPQIVLGLLVSADGCHLAYSINKGKKYEGHTMLPVIEEFVKEYALKDFIIVADSGMLNEDNIKQLESNNYIYIIGARIKNSNKELTNWILSLEKKEGLLHEQKRGNNDKIIIGYSEARAKKDKHNREKGIKSLEKKYQRGKITKSNITQRGYNKFLTIVGEDNITVEIDSEKTIEDAKWDGLKDYITNSELDNDKIGLAYNNLFNVEQSFRTSKSNLEIRPIFLFNHERIKVHISICFVALKVYKELERLLKLNNIKFSVDKVLEIAKTVVTIKIRLNNDKYDSENIYKETLFLTNRHKLIKPLLEDDFLWTANFY